MADPKIHKSVSVPKPAYDMAKFLQTKIIEDTKLSISKVVETALRKVEETYTNSKRSDNMRHKSMAQMNAERKKNKKKYNAVHAYSAMLKLFREAHGSKAKNKI